MDVDFEDIVKAIGGDDYEGSLFGDVPGKVAPSSVSGGSALVTLEKSSRSSESARTPAQARGTAGGRSSKGAKSADGFQPCKA